MLALDLTALALGKTGVYVTSSKLHHNCVAGQKKAARPQGSRSARTPNFPVAHFVRFTEEDNNLILDAAEKSGRPVARYLREVAVAAVKNQPPPPMIPKRNPPQKQGTELDDIGDLAPAVPRTSLQNRIEAAYARITAPEPTNPPVATSPVTVPQVVINTGNAPASTTTPELDRLVTYINKAAGPLERAQRLQLVTDILEAGARDDNERRLLAQTLRERLGMKTNAASQTSFVSALSDFFLGK